MPLSDTACKNAHKHDKAATGKAFTLFDDKGLHLLLKPLKDSWAKWWRIKYRFDGKDCLLSLGTYPEVSLQQAREQRDSIRKQIANGINPSENRKAVKSSKAESAANSFEVIAREWYENKMGDKSTDHKKRVTGLFERDLFPYIGSKPITDLKAPELLAALRRIEARNAIETAHRALQVCGQVFRYAIATGRTERDITPDLRGSLKTVKSGHFSAVTKPKQAAELLRAIDGYCGSFVVKSALQLAPLVFVRPGELRQAEWEHIDFEAKEWRYLVTKTDTDHIVPLSVQSINILQELKPLTGNGRYVFPSARTPNGSRPMSDMALLAALRRMGISKEEMTVHGFRALARTVLDEVLGFRPDFIEHQLAHAVRDPNGRAYNRTAHLPERHKMMQSWADYLDGLKSGAQVIAFKKAG
ncbi:MAG: integrase arm-type DNA-binding domain-containing protein [Methylovulum sp.]|uniref:tyrosine-type recombinase/integrase n=1 Tax=Methylovulum sp. TaxID=1916980 RepID=UPI00260C057A|nr:integrase arm-type DNA-binding domain-containing protein [Methylovulum sp.]MDD2724523.1 integrase arm-type DNA-binding domain-containing protein [Methylovulum sp.]MDD5124046.1 integrase arm-type DNA-binding domain-containing protein [Methylovulum sp.]